MSGTKKHIDELFREGLKNFSLLVSNKDLEAIDDKTSIYKEQENPGSEGLFGSFEIEVGESDWLSTKAKLENEKAAMAQDHLMAAGLKDLEMPIRSEDWTLTYNKLRAAKKRRLAYWWLSAGVVILALGIFFAGRSYKDTPAIVTAVTEQNENLHADIKEPVIKEQPETQALENQDPANTKKSEQDYSRNSPSAPEHTVLNTHNTREIGSSRPEPAAEKVSPDLKQSDKTAENKYSKTEVPDYHTNAPENLQSQVKGQGHTGKPQIGDPVVITDLRSVAKNTGEETIQQVEGDKTAASFEERTTGQTTAEMTNEAEKVTETEPADTNKKKDKSELTPKTPKTRIYVGLVAQAGSTSRHLDKLNNSTYNAVRNNADKPFTQFTYGFEAGIQKKKSRISVGLQGTSQSWISNYKYSYRVYDSLPFKDPNGHIIGYFLVRGRDTFIDESNTVRIEKVQIPFEFTQLFKVTSRMDAVASVSGTIGLNTRSEGSKMINPANNYLSLYKHIKDQERTMSFVPMLSLGVQYQFNKTFAIQGAAFGNYSITSRFKNSFPAKDYPYTIGATVKLLYFIK